eukprot:CAMPEP_0174827706 /NCGR_PEP_ID=MMETSP1114-20130205/888_1 /TAXON_ID=312471 /ORGANISM="Neobodo designis, Strain CCAP 1951/1" /LENGTH=161 /DNA_ID=CAMNT_0016061381 /DNA_START=77 /DNA_END=562 /DNA_ORIENTATION=-
MAQSTGLARGLSSADASGCAFAPPEADLTFPAAPERGSPRSMTWRVTPQSRRRRQLSVSRSETPSTTVGRCPLHRARRAARKTGRQTSRRETAPPPARRGLHPQGRQQPCAAPRVDSRRSADLRDDLTTDHACRAAAAHGGHPLIFTLAFRGLMAAFLLLN